MLRIHLILTRISKCFVIFMLKFDVPLRDGSYLGCESKRFLPSVFWLIICRLDPADPQIRITFRIQIQEAKMLPIQRMLILSTVCNPNLICQLSSNCKLTLFCSYFVSRLQNIITSYQEIMKIVML